MTMNGIRRWMAVLLAGTAVTAALAESGRVEVQSDRVNLRARPRDEAEVAGQVNTGMILEYRGTNLEWVAVTPPTNVGLWVSSEFVKDSKVATDKLNVRAGAGINYPPVGQLYKGDSVVSRSQVGPWMEIVPPTNATLWIHRDYAKITLDRASETASVVPATPVTVSPAVPYVRPGQPPATPVAVLPSPASVKDEPALSRPPDLKERELVPLAGQGEAMEREGSLHKTSIFDFGRISNYCLMDWDRGRPLTVCYIRGNNAQLKEFEGKRLRVKGDGYWIKGSAKPVLVPREITPLLATEP
jgi:hypothetical protein